MRRRAEEQRAAAAEGHRGRVLLAEDDRDMRSLVARSLRATGYEVLEAADGLGLLNLVEVALGDRETIDARTVVVSDIRMRRLDGIRVLAALRQLRLGIPVILVTSFGDEETRASALALGAAELLDKPFDMKELRRVIARVLEGSAQSIEPPSPTIR